MKLYFICFLLGTCQLFAFTQEKNDPNKISREISLGNTLFGYELEKKLVQKHDNLVFSPFSISACLSMVMVGAKGETYQQMKQVLHLPELSAEVDLGFKNLFQNLEEPQSELDKIQLNLAQSLWLQKDGQFLPLYQSRVVNNFMGQLRYADFENHPNEARLDINRWVFDKTRGKIKNIFSKGQITAATELALVSTIFLKAPWLQPFDITHTRDKTFQVSDDKQITLPFMYQKNTFPFYEGKGFKAIELPYLPGKTEVVLWIILPKNGDHLEDLRNSFDLSMADELKENLTPKPIELELPKFQIESDLSLVDTLKALGMTLPFTTEADFSLMFEGAELMLSQVQHKSIVQIDEKGTIAAAATGATMITKAMPDPDHWISFHIDRPFLFVIKEKKSDTILFMGQVKEPQPLTAGIN